MQWNVMRAAAARAFTYEGYCETDVGVLVPYVKEINRSTATYNAWKDFCRQHDFFHVTRQLVP